jgi:hypothetical protein
MLSGSALWLSSCCAAGIISNCSYSEFLLTTPDGVDTAHITQLLPLLLPLLLPPLLLLLHMTDGRRCRGYLVSRKSRCMPSTQAPCCNLFWSGTKHKYVVYGVHV